MPHISRDNPCFYLTCVPKDRLPVFRLDALKKVACEAIGEARQSAGFAIYAYVIMPDHIHLVTDSARESSEILRFVNGITSRRIINWLKENNHQSSLASFEFLIEKGSTGTRFGIIIRMSDYCGTKRC
ncbi:MAG: transposase [Pyrinomonadaceae bacterium]